MAICLSHPHTVIWRLNLSLDNTFEGYTLTTFLVAQTYDYNCKASAYNAGDPSSIPGLGRSPGEGNGNPLQSSCLENEEAGRLQYMEYTLEMQN